MVRNRLALGLVAALLVGACGDGGGGTSESTVSAPASETSSTPPGTDPPAATVPRAPIAADAPTKALAAGLNDAGFDLLRTRPVDGNVVLSPSSIGHALLMASAAGDRATRTAIEQAFGLPPGAHDAWNAIDRRIAAAQGDDVTVRIADRLWPRTGLVPERDWTDLLASKHGAEAEPLDLAGDPEGSRQRINEWVSDETEGLIPELLPEGFITPQTLLVLTDALYFEARWQTVFGKYSPITKPFTRLDGSTVDVELMQQLELADRRGRGDGFVGAEIPYAGDDFSMLVIVPGEGRFEEVRQRLDQALLDDIDDTFTKGPYELRLPRWETTTKVDLLAWLTELGAAPGSYPAIDPDAFLDAAVHAADIAVDEWGTVAAAATGLAFTVSGPPQPEFVVAADQPFLYLIRHRSSGLVLFAGQVTDPTA